MALKATTDVWANTDPIWANTSLNVLGQREILQADVVSLDELIQKSEEFPIAFPIDTTRCQTLRHDVPQGTLEKNINSVYPLLHVHALILYSQFILHKRTLGTKIERELYKNMDILGLVDRLLTKRAVSFYEISDIYLLLDGTQGQGNWGSIGKDNETGKLTLSNCLSYDEIKLSALLSVSSRTHFINDGNRQNKGVPSRDSEKSGVIIGLIGTRLEKPKVMEFQEIVVTEEQNNESNRYGSTAVPTMPSVFAGFYGDVAYTYRQVFDGVLDQQKRFTQIPQGYFNNFAYTKRISLSIDTLLLEANHRAKEEGSTAYVHVVGIGLGVWALAPHQKELFLDTFAWRIQSLGPHLYSISDVHFAHFTGAVSSGGFTDRALIPIEGHPKQGIKIYISHREPHAKLAEEHQGKLLVVSYAWDGNSLPGNVYWLGQLDNTGDPAAACSTQTPELHNPHINPKASAKNLHIATKDGVVSFGQYRDAVTNVNL